MIVVIPGMLAACIDELLARPFMTAARALIMIVDLSLKPADTSRGGVHGLAGPRRQADSPLREAFFSFGLENIDIIVRSTARFPGRRP